MRSESSRVKIIFLKQLAFPVVDTLLVEAIEGNITFPTLPSSSSSLTSPLSDSLWINFFPYTTRCNTVCTIGGSGCCDVSDDRK